MSISDAADQIEEAYFKQPHIHYLCGPMASYLATTDLVLMWHFSQNASHAHVATKTLGFFLSQEAITLLLLCKLFLMKPTYTAAWSSKSSLLPRHNKPSTTKQVKRSICRVETILQLSVKTYSVPLVLCIKATSVSAFVTMIIVKLI